MWLVINTVHGGKYSVTELKISGIHMILKTFNLFMWLLPLQ